MQRNQKTGSDECLSKNTKKGGERGGEVNHVENIGVFLIFIVCLCLLFPTFHFQQGKK